MRTVAKEVFEFSELSDAAKEKAREWYRTEFEFDAEFEPFETAAKILGIDLTEERSGKRSGTWYRVNTIRYSGFWSQGDGASFTGTYAFNPGCSQAIREEFSTDSTLHEIADNLTALHVRLRLKDGGKLAGKITQKDHRYSHSHTMDATAYDANDEEMDVAVSDEFRDLMRNFADWIYKGLEEQYYSDTSDEAIDGTIEANGYEFTEEGEIA
jgi:hypothetical protein